MKLADEKLIFESSGREEYQYGDTIGLSPRRGPTYGADGEFYFTPALTPAEREELADHMIGLWTAFRNEKAKEA